MQASGSTCIANKTHEMPCGVHVHLQLTPSGPAPGFSHAHHRKDPGRVQARRKLHLQGKYCFVEFSGPLYKHCGSASGFFLPVSYLRLFQGAPGSQMPEVRKICALGELAVSKGDRMDLGTLPGVSENPGVGLVGGFFQRLVQRQCMDTHVDMTVCLYTYVYIHYACMWLIIHVYAFFHVVFVQWQQQG